MHNAKPSFDYNKPKLILPSKIFKDADSISFPCENLAH